MTSECDPGETAPDDAGRTLERVADLYAKNVRELGQQAKSVGWRNEEQHLLRFEKLAELIEESGPFTVNDLGCGYGAMFDWLAEKYGDRLTGYTGYDIAPEMLDAARERVEDERAVFVQSGRATRTADYSFVSGTFHVRFEASDREWAAFIRESLVHLASKSERGLAFNLLSTYVDWKEDHLFYGDPAEYFGFSKRHLSKYVSLLHDYPLFEWTILVRKEPPETVA